MTTTAPPAHRLTDRQIKAIALIAIGTDRARTARTLGMAVPTLDDDLQSARHRLGALNLPHLVALAIAAGVIPVDVATGTEVTR